MAKSISHQKDAVRSGYWPLYRFDPGAPEHPFHLDSKEPAIGLAEFAMQEARFAMLARIAPADSDRLMAEAQDDVTERWDQYRQLAEMHRVPPHLPAAAAPSTTADDEDA
jgi:pyruvate-ferredoxin/flavodoxin oxidoreductase